MVSDITLGQFIVLTISLESVFASNASPERKYIGFQLVEQISKRIPATLISHLFTRNFVRTWINQLARQDRYLHKAALKLVRQNSNDFCSSNYGHRHPLSIRLSKKTHLLDFHLSSNSLDLMEVETLTAFRTRRLWRLS